MIERKCRSCGAPVPFKTAISLLAVCPHCQSLVKRDDLDVESLGKSAQLLRDGSPLQLGARGAYKTDPFEVVGRVQLKTKTGLWNEWALAFADGRAGWLGEAQGTYAVSFRSDAPAPKALKLGGKADLAGRTYRVRELVEAQYLAAEGELPYKPPLGRAVKSADLISPDGYFATIDESEDPALVFVGEYEEFEELHFTGLRTFEGWPAP